MTILARAGVPGLVLWVLFLLSWLGTMTAGMLSAHSRGDSEWARLFLWIVCYVMAFVINASFDANSRRSGPRHLVLVPAGIRPWCDHGLSLADQHRANPSARRDAMKILMSAFSCGPGLGSDPGIGWNMAKETARLGHEVVVLTQTEFQAEIERERAAGALPRNIRFDIFMPSWLERLRDVGLDLGLTSLTWHVVSIAWQFCALAHVRRHYKSAEFDLVHHVSLSGVRHPTLLNSAWASNVHWSTWRRRASSDAAPQELLLEGLVCGVAARCSYLVVTCRPHDARSVSRFHSYFPADEGVAESRCAAPPRQGSPQCRAWNNRRICRNDRMSKRR